MTGYTQGDVMEFRVVLAQLEWLDTQSLPQPLAEAVAEATAVLMAMVDRYDDGGYIPQPWHHAEGMIAVGNLLRPWHKEVQAMVAAELYSQWVAYGSSGMSFPGWYGYIHSEDIPTGESVTLVDLSNWYESCLDDIGRNVRDTVYGC